MKRKLISVLTLVSILFCTITMNVFATDINQTTIATNDDTQINLLLRNSANVSMKLSFSGTTATCYSNIVGQTGTTSITGSAELRKMYTNGTYDVVKSWTGLSGTRTLSINKTATVSKGYTYCFVIDVEVVRNGVSESITMEKEGSY